MAWAPPDVLGAGKGDWKAGVAVRAITPAEPMWMSGYAARTKPAEGKLQDLYVKALALEDPAGGKLVLVTSEILPLALVGRCTVNVCTRLYYISIVT